MQSINRSALETLFADVQALADARFDEVLVRLLTADIPEMPEPPEHCCLKCGPLLREYVRSKIALHRFKKRHDWDWGMRWPVHVDSGFVLESHVEKARIAFHAVPECACGLQLWRGKNWREKQAQSYQDLWLAYVTQHRGMWVGLNTENTT